MLCCTAFHPTIDMISASYILDQTLDMSLSSSSTFSLSNDTTNNSTTQHKSEKICISTLLACLLIVLSLSELSSSSKHSARRHNALVIIKLYEEGVLLLNANANKHKLLYHNQTLHMIHLLLAMYFFASFHCLILAYLQ